MLDRRRGNVSSLKKSHIVHVFHVWRHDSKKVNQEQTQIQPKYNPNTTCAEQTVRRRSRNQNMSPEDELTLKPVNTEKWRETQQQEVRLQTRGELQNKTGNTPNLVVEVFV